MRGRGENERRRRKDKRGIEDERGGGGSLPQSPPFFITLLTLIPVDIQAGQCHTGGGVSLFFPH